MNRKSSLFIFYLIVILSFSVKAQIENVIVETYYVSDTNDATDTIGGILEPGSTTYRVYIDLAPGCKMKKIFGDANHTLRFSSTAPFWNNLDRGQTFGKGFSISNLHEGTVALDTYLTIGQVTKNSSITYFGVLKTEDPDTSIIGGVHNDGGWSAIPDGLIANQAAAAGIPVTLKDGLDTMANAPTYLSQDGILDPTNGDDSTMFGSLKVDSQFVSNNASLQYEPMPGVIPSGNKVLVAQLTTKGELSFELNVVVQEPTLPNPTDVTYIAQLAATDTVNSSLQLSPYLKYPQSCGCTDPHYIEYSNTYACNDQSACKTLIVYGCMDTQACNYDPNANFNIPSLCCYPGYCNDRDLGTVCPSLNNERMRAAGSRLYPNPAQDELTLEIPQGVRALVQFGILDAYGNTVMHKNLGVVSNSIIEKTDVSRLAAGLYMLRMQIGNGSYIKKFVKN